MERKVPGRWEHGGTRTKEGRGGFREEGKKKMALHYPSINWGRFLRTIYEKKEILIEKEESTRRRFLGEIWSRGAERKKKKSLEEKESSERRMNISESKRENW